MARKAQVRELADGRCEWRVLGTGNSEEASGVEGNRVSAESAAKRYRDAADNFGGNAGPWRNID